MAGNSISVPVIGCLLAVVLASCDFGGTTETGSKNADDGGVEWVGPNRIPGASTSVDTLYDAKDDKEPQSRKRPAAMRKPSSKLKQTKLDDAFRS